VDITTPNEASSNCGGRLIYATRFGLGREINALLVHGGCHPRCRSKLTGSFNHYRARWLGEVVGDPLQGKHFRPSPTGTLIAHPPFFNIDFFFHVHNILQICQKPGMDRNYCLIVFIGYMSYSDT
jgi:hypothetical protein